MGGYVSETRVWRDGDQTNAVVTLRVPADKVAATVAVVRAIAERVEGETMRYNRKHE
jgi:hypothetical protein